jgi:drug/metabolite transporter, DME family
VTAANRQSFRGYFYIASAAFCFAVSATLGRAAFTGRWGHGLQAIDPLILSQSRTTIAFLILLPAMVFTRGRHRLRLPLPDFSRALLLGVLGVAASNYFYFVAIQRTNVATAITVQYTAPIWVLFYSVARGLQRPTWQRASGVALAVAGIAVVLGVFDAGGFRLDALGVTAALLAAFSFAFYNIGGHRLLAHYDHWIVLLYTTFAASVLWMGFNPPWKIAAAHFSAGEGLFLFLFSLTSVLVPFALYFAGLRYLEPTRAIVISCLEPVFAILIAALVLGESLHGLQVFGIVLVLAAIVVVQMPDGKAGAMIPLEPLE